MLLYVHIPFCDSKCYYCSFNSYVNNHHLKQDYMDSLVQQLKYELKRFAISEVNQIETLFIGGGTPSTISPELYSELFTTIKHFFSKNIEISIEANPNSITEKWLIGMLNLGVNRLSIGVQSFNDEKLKFLGRNHTSEIAINSIKLANKVGFQRLSIDLIYNTVVETPKLLLDDLNQALSLPINHISTYSLTQEKGTVFTDESAIKENINATKDLISLLDIHYGQYEISNFGDKCRHNMGYWEGKDYIGIGSGAVGFKKNKRFYSNKNLKEYISNPIDVKIEYLTFENLRLERVFQGFRSIVGVNKDDILNHKIAQELIKDKILYFENNRYYNKNFLLADEIAIRI